MKKYKVIVNGIAYEIELEEMTGAAPVAAAPVAAPVAAPAPAAPAPAAPAAGEPVTSPLPGTVLNIKVNVGDKVSAGQVLLVLEAMKMENDIVAPKDGVVTGITVAKGAAVEAGATLCTIQ